MAQKTLDVWEKFSERLRSFILKRIADPTDADDVLQQIFIKVHTHIGTLRDEERIAPWLYQIAKNTITDYYRAQRQCVAIPETLIVEVEPDGEDSISQLATGLRHLIETLPDNYRQPLLLAEIEGLPQKEMAEQLRLSLSAAKSRVQRGRRLLRAALLSCCHFELDHRGRLMDYAPPADCRHCNSA